jgi:membrane dipeptidase
MPADLHRTAIVADTHNDLLCLVVKRPPTQWASYFRERWLPQLVSGGVDIQVLPVYIDDGFRPELALRETLRMIEAAHRLAEGNADAVALCSTGEEVRRVLDSGRIALVLALEGCPQIDTDIELLQTMFRLGVRIASFTHFGRSALADGSGEDAAESRLTGAGTAALELMQELGMLLDVSHLGKRGVDHVLELSRRPLIATHSSAHALRAHHRNLSDDHLRGIAATGGVVCVNFCAGFLDEHEHEHTVERLVDHVVHVAEVAGLDHVGLGPDFVDEVLRELYPGQDTLRMGGIDALACVPGLEGPTGLPLVTAALLDRGLSPSDVGRVVGGNVARLFDAELGRPRGAERAPSTSLGGVPDGGGVTGRAAQ